MSKSEEIMNIATRRGFLYPSAEIYKSTAGFWTYGHLGTRLKHKWENSWRKSFLKLNPRFMEIDDCVIMPKKVFESSGHLEHFNDPLVNCTKCNNRFAADELIEEKTKTNVEGVSAENLTKIIQDNKIKCSMCKGELGEVKIFNMMFDLKVGVFGENTMYLRPESAQAPYLAYKREVEAMRGKFPFGLAVIGKAFRNEISPRQGFFRLREFTQAELQIFFDPKELNKHENFKEIKDYQLILQLSKDKKPKKIKCSDLNTKLKIPKFYVYHLAKVQQFYLETLQIPGKKFKLRELDAKARAFYNKIHFDIEVDMETLGGFKEVGGVHYRGDHDLSGHQKGSKTKLEVNQDGNKFLPHVLELSFGVDRNIWMLMDIFYKKEKERELFNFPKVLSPFDVAVFPLVKKDKLPEISKKIFEDLFENFNVFYDDGGSIGRRYRRQDEIGTYTAITVDFETLENNTVTLRDRDSMKQKRVDIKELKNSI